ncbi:NUDIX hydrolase [Thalassotalea profundi]|uniref:Phosphatase NudJ n=1 Tax=Thalassotalea profundi TaxID=2036687 RepID=A0ABQ3IJM2_9GAMM|nr:NUDIX hydrolase [Thalassotalea profundi]GHE83020.1 NUDIX hydrolase [Thalassotalea profundi]
MTPSQSSCIAVSPHGAEQFKPNTTVAAVIVCNNKFLLVEEIENGKSVYNQPAGHLEANENLINACKREVLEETGLTITPEYCSGVYYFHRPELSLYFLRFCFVVKLQTIPECQPQDDEIIATHWLTLDEIREKSAQLRSSMVLECIEDYLTGNKIDLSMIKSNF